jgi:ankyrin repeat protein
VLDYSIENGHTEVVKEILNDGRVHLDRKALTSRARQPITIAAATGNWDIVNLLINQPGVDPNVQCNYVLQEAYKVTRDLIKR